MTILKGSGGFELILTRVQAANTLLALRLSVPREDTGASIRPYLTSSTV